MSFAFRHEGREVDGAVEFAITPNGTIRTRESSKGDDWMDATQFVTEIVAERETEGFFGPGTSSAS